MGFFFGHLRLGPEEKLQMKEELSKIEPAEQQKFMKLTNPFIEEGLEKGLEKGIEQGRRAEAASLVLRQLRRRLGDLEPADVAMVERLEVTKLELLAEALLDFGSAADLAVWLSRTEDRGMAESV